MKKGIKKTIAFTMGTLLTIGLILGGVVPHTSIKVKAADGEKTVASLATDAVEKPTQPGDKDSEWQGNYVWYGKYNGNPVKYRVLDNKTTDYGSNTILLDCDSILFKTYFDEDGKGNVPGNTDIKANNWEYSDLKNNLNDDMFLNGSGANGSNNFTNQEKAAIANSTKAGYTLKENTSYVTGPDKWFKEYKGLTGEQIFVLDVSDTLNKEYGYSDYCGKNTDGSGLWHNVDNRNKKLTDTESAWAWWFRSPYSEIGYGVAGVYNDGRVTNASVRGEEVGVSPAFNINLSSVIFSSIIKGTAGNKDAEFKLTIEDNNLNVALATSKIASISSNDIVTIPYMISGDNKDNATQVSVLILNKEYKPGNTNGAKIMYYGKLATGNTFSTTGEGTFDFGAFAKSNNETFENWGNTYKVYILAEDVNGEKETDYASKPIPVVKEYEVTLNAGQNMTKDTSSGETTQTVSCGSQINDIVFSADEGYYFPEDYSVDSVNGINVERNGFKSIKVSGIPTDNATVTLKDAAAKTKADTPTLIATQPATINDKGSIPTTKAHEKSTDGVNWEDCDGEWTDLSEGTYYVRERESETKFASDAQTIIISVDKYVITFEDEDGKVLQQCEFASGDTPVYNGETPTKASTDTKVYTFNGWIPNITEVTGEATYVAAFSEDEKPKEPNTEEIQPEEPKNPSEETKKPEKKADYLDDLYAKLNNAKAQGGKQTVEWSAGDSLPYEVMKILEENKDITLIFSYTYGGEAFCVTISGENVKADPDVPWCGPLYLYSIYGDYTLGEKGIQSSGTYIIQYGDTLTSLAAKFNTTIKNLVALNNIKDPDLIYAGDELKY